MPRTITRVAVILMLLAGSHGAQAWGAGGARAAIEASNRRFSELFTQGKASELAAMYSEDAIVLPPGQEPVGGREALTALWQGMIDSKMKDFKLTTIDVQESGALATETGRYAFTQANGQPASGNYLVVWKREKGAWKLARDIWN